MNQFLSIIKPVAFGLFLFICSLQAAPESWAAGGDATWRPMYDLILRWFNFFLLVFILVKYARKPLINFLKGKQEEVGNAINRIEQQKEAIDQSVRAAREKLQKSADRQNEMRGRIIRQGEKKKQQIIQEAKKESQRILDDAKEKIAGEIIIARKTIREELIDAAIEKALLKLPQKISSDDHQDYIEMFLTGTTGK